MRMRSLWIIRAMFWPLMATKDTFAFLDPSSQGTVLMTPHLKPHSLTERGSPAPGLDPAPTLVPVPIPGRTGHAQRGAPVGPQA